MFWMDDAEKHAMI